MKRLLQRVFSGPEEGSPQTPLRFGKDSRGNSVYRLLVVGDGETGKTCLGRRFASGYFSHEPKFAGVELLTTTVELDGTKITVQTWDVAASERSFYKGLVERNFRFTHGFVLVYDTTRRETFENLGSWVESIRRHNSSGVIILVGSKCDLADAKTVDYLKAKEFADEKGMLLFEASAMDDTNVELAFMTLVSKVRELEDSVVAHGADV